MKKIALLDLYKSTVAQGKCQVTRISAGQDAIIVWPGLSCE